MLTYFCASRHYLPAISCFMDLDMSMEPSPSAVSLSPVCQESEIYMAGA